MGKWISGEVDQWTVGSGSVGKWISGEVDQWGNETVGK